MNFELSEEQVMLRNMTREFAEREMLPTTRVMISNLRG